jgi:hypothetical protein
MSARGGPFHPLRIDAAPCDADVLQQHLAAFLRSFIRRDRRERAEHIVFRLAPDDSDRLGELHRMLDERYSSPPRELRLPHGLPEAGVYYAGGTEGWMVQRADAEMATGFLGRDAIWSAVPGVYAWFLFHENLRWECYRP